MLQTLLDHQREALHPLPHIGVAHGDPYPHTRRDHRSTLKAADTCAGDADAKTLTRLPRARSMIGTGATGELCGTLTPAMTDSAKSGLTNWLDAALA